MTRNRQRRAPSRLGTAFACSVGSLVLLLSAPRPATAQTLDPKRADIAEFITEIAQRHGFEPAALEQTFAAVESRPPILQAIARPAEKTLTWDVYRSKFLTDRRIDRGVQVYREQQAHLEQAQRTSGVPADIMLGIVGVETLYGEITGRHRVIDALATLAFDYPPRAKFFRGELEQFLLMAREEKLDPLSPLGSYAGAMGIPQFMPTSFRNWAVDGDADGTRDLWGDWADVFASVGNYLKVHGWRAGEPVMVAADVEGANLDNLEMGKLALAETVGSLRARGIKFETTLAADAPATLVALTVPFGREYRVGFTNFYALTRYNRSQLYASAVNDLAEAIGVARNTPATTGAAAATATVPTAPTTPMTPTTPTTPAAPAAPAAPAE
jgi:membrane-bound lytic murein transglycosylase B